MERTRNRKQNQSKDWLPTQHTPVCCAVYLFINLWCFLWRGGFEKDCQINLSSLNLSLASWPADAHMSFLQHATFISTQRDPLWQCVHSFIHSFIHCSDPPAELILSSSSTMAESKICRTLRAWSVKDVVVVVVVVVSCARAWNRVSLSFMVLDNERCWLASCKTVMRSLSDVDRCGFFSIMLVLFLLRDNDVLAEAEVDDIASQSSTTQRDGRLNRSTALSLLLEGMLSHREEDPPMELAVEWHEASIILSPQSSSKSSSSSGNILLR